VSLFLLILSLAFWFLRERGEKREERGERRGRLSYRAEI